MRILAFDSATRACSVAVWTDGRVEAARSQCLARGQAEAIVPMIDAYVLGRPMPSSSSALTSEPSL